MHKRIISIILIISLIVPNLVFANDDFSTGQATAIQLMNAAHGQLNQNHPIQQIKDLQEAYNKQYDALEAHVTDPDKLKIIQERRADANKAFEDQINVLRRRRDRNNIFNNAAKGLERAFTPVVRATKWSLRTVGEGVVLGAKTVIKMLPKSPEELLGKYIEYLTAGGGLSIKDFLVKQFKNRFSKEAKKVLVQKTAEVLKMPELVTILSDDETSGEGADEGEGGYEDEEADDPVGDEGEGGYDDEGADEPVGYEGEGGYDDEESDEPVSDEGEGGYDDEEPIDLAELIPGTHDIIWTLDSFNCVPKDEFTDGWYSAEEQERQATNWAEAMNEGYSDKTGHEYGGAIEVYLDDESKARVYMDYYMQPELYGISRMDATYSGQSFTWDFEDGNSHYTGSATFSMDEGSVKVVGGVIATNYDSQHQCYSTKTFSFRSPK